MNPTNYISFSLWGDNPKYTIGAVWNAHLAKVFFPEWTPVFYVSRDVAYDVRQQLERLGALIVDCRNETRVPPSMWRYLAADIPKCSRFISRDCDSRLSARDKVLVDQWIASGKACQFIQDHPGHDHMILAGGWGCTPSFFDTSFRKLLEKYCVGDNSYGRDMLFLKHVIWPKGSTNMLLSKDLIEKPEYVGQVYDEAGNAVEWTQPTWSEWVK